MRAWLKRWGEYLLALLCVLVIVFAAVYTRQEDLQRIAARSAAGSQDQTLRETAPPPAWQQPVEGEVLQPFLGARRSAGGLWRIAPFVCYAAAAGQPVCAMAAGVIQSAQAGAVVLLQADGVEIAYSNLGALRVRAGERVEAGQRIAAAGGDGFIRVCARQNGAYIDPESLLSF